MDYKEAEKLIQSCLEPYEIDDVELQKIVLLMSCGIDSKNPKPLHTEAVDRLARRASQEVLAFDSAHQLLLEQPLRTDPIHRHHSYLVRGQYIDQLLRWQQYFPNDRFLVLQTEELFRNPPSVLSEVLRFLDRPVSQSDLIFEDLDTREHDILDDDLRNRLRRHFEPYNQRLFDHIGRSFDWE